MLLCCIQRQWTPLHLAARDGHTEIVDLLVKNGADINIKDNVSYVVI